MEKMESSDEPSQRGIGLVFVALVMKDVTEILLMMSVLDDVCSFIGHLGRCSAKSSRSSSALFVHEWLTKPIPNDLTPGTTQHVGV